LSCSAVIGYFVYDMTLQQITRAKVGTVLDSEVTEGRVGKM